MFNLSTHSGLSLFVCLSLSVARLHMQLMMGKDSRGRGEGRKEVYVCVCVCGAGSAERELAAEGAGGGSVAMVVTRGRRGGREGGEREEGVSSAFPLAFLFALGFFFSPAPEKTSCPPGPCSQGGGARTVFHFSARSARSAVCFSLFFFFFFFPFLSFRFFFPLSFIFLGKCPFSLSGRCFIRLLTGKQLGPPPWVDPPLLATDFIYICVCVCVCVVCVANCCHFSFKKFGKKINFTISFFVFWEKKKSNFYFIFKSPQSLSI